MQLAGLITPEVELFLGFVAFLLSTYIGYSVYTQNRKSWTNKLFALIAFFIDLYIVVNYLSLHPFTQTPDSQLFWIRVVMFTTSFFGPLLFLLVHTIPGEYITLRKKYLIPILSLMILSAFCSLTPAVFKGIEYPNGEPVPVPGPGMLVFLLAFPGLCLASVAYLVYRFRKSQSIVRKQLKLFLAGILVTFSVMPLATVILVVFFKTSAGVFIGPLISVVLMSFIAYAIVRYGIFNTKVFATKVLVIVIVIIIISRIFFAPSLTYLLVDVAVLASIIVFGYLLVKSVKAEVFQREKLGELAHSLEKANLRLTQLDQQKTEFLSIASHQLRTPLSILKGYIELIQDSAYGKPSKKLQSVLLDMDESNERLVKLVDEFLDITRIEQGRTKFVFKNYKINELISGVVKELHQRAEDRGISIAWKKNSEIADVCMDEEKVRHVIFNYIDNAIKYSNKGSIKVSVEREDGGITVRVKDNGFGFNSVDQANFFQKFYRGENVKGTNVNGTGLGIYVCRKFIEAHNGHVWAHSEGLDKGSEFGFWIPDQPDKKN
ncbi:MAG: ATP-binding protein [Candidatus Magasanikbacteria bacterium]